jgi:hypothetical protein
MIPKGDYLRLLPEFYTPYGMGYNELLYFDYIYDSVDFDMNEYPCGLFLTKGDAMSVFSCLYDYEPPSNRFNYTSYFWKEDGKYEELTLPLFYVTRSDVPLPVDKVPTELFVRHVHPYRDITNEFKVYKDGFYQMIRGSTKPINDIFLKYAPIKTHWHYNSFNDFKFQNLCNSQFYRIHFLDDSKVSQHFKNNDIYDFCERYCFVYNQDNDLGYMLDPEFVDHLNKNYDHVIEPFIVDDENYKDFTPTMQFHAIFLKNTKDLYKLRDYIKRKIWKCVPFHSSQSLDKTNQFYIKNYALVYKNTMRWGLCKFVVLDDHRFSKNDFAIGFDRLRQTEHLEKNLKKKNLIWDFYETFMPDSHKHIYEHTYATNEKFFRRLKIHNYKDAGYITHVFINKYLLDMKGK